MLDDAGIVWCAERPKGPACGFPRLGRLLKDYLPASNIVLPIDDVAFGAAAVRLGRGDNTFGDALYPPCMNHVAGHLALILVRVRRVAVGPRHLRACQGLLGSAGIVETISAEAGERVSHLGELGGVATTVRLRTIQRVAVPTPNTAAPATDAATGCGRSAGHRTRRPGQR